MNHSTSRPLRAAVILGALALGLATLVGTSSSATAADPSTGAPAVGTCYNLTQADTPKESLTKAPVDCAKAHTTIVLSTVQVGSDFSDMQAVSEKISTGCHQKLAGALGGSAAARAQSLYSWIWFAPTEAERADGAQWATCLVFLSDGGPLYKLPAKRPLITGALSAAEKRCLSTKKGAVVSCATKHDFRSVKPFKITGAYPSDERGLKLAAKQCPKRVSSKAWYYTYSSKNAFRAGWKSMVCYEKSRA